MRLVIFSAVMAVLAACATTNITGFTDPDYRGRKYASYLVATPNLNLEYSMVLQGKICDSLATQGGRCTRALDLFPPTRSFNEGDIANTLRKNAIDGYLIVVYGGGSTQSQYLGSLNYGTASVVGNTVTAYGSSVPMASFSRSDGYSLILVDTATYNKAWVGGAKTSAQGLANITDDVFTTSLAREIGVELQRAGHL